MYSHSRLSMFEQCPLRYRFRYVDRVKVERREGVEAFLGSRVHEALEKLHGDLMHEKSPSMEELRAFLEGRWEAEWHEGVHIQSPDYGEEEYRRVAIRCLEDYYRRHQPFDEDRTLGLESRVTIRLDDDGAIGMIGFIDRLAKVSDSHLRIHDYKTGRRLATQEEADADRQLALYAIAVHDSFPEAERVDLVWHYLAFDHVVVSSRTREQLESLKAETRELIGRIESCSDFPARSGALCPWCEYMGICPEFAHLAAMEDAVEEEAMDAAAMVDRCAELKEGLKGMTASMQAEIDALEEGILRLAEEKGYAIVYGKTHQAKVHSQESFRQPRKNSPEQDSLVALLGREGLLEGLMTLDGHALRALLLENPTVEALIAAELPGVVERAPRRSLRLQARKL